MLINSYSFRSKLIQVILGEFLQQPGVILMRADQEMRPAYNNYRMLMKLNSCLSSSSFLVRRLVIIFLPLSVMSVVVFYKLVPAVTGSYSSYWSPLPLKSPIYNSGSSSHVTLTANQTISSHNEATRDQPGQEPSISKSNTESEDHELSVDRRSYSELEKLEASLARARASIREAALVRNLTSTHQDSDYVPVGPMYWNANAFHRSFLEMEKLFKIYVYEEGEPPLFHDGPFKNIYSSEGSFIRDLEFNNIYRTKDPDKALVFFLPFSVVKLVHYLIIPGSRRFNDDIGRPVLDYINVISSKYTFWNRSLAADHFMLSCHDWGPTTSKMVPNLFHKSIRVLCNANTSEGFNPSKDVTLPEINLVTGEVTQLLGGLSPSHRPILAFFAGREHGYIRSILFENKDQDIQVYEHLPEGVSYSSLTRKSRFCLCPSGYEVASPRIVEAIYAACVPVIIKDGYVPPLSDVLNWRTFSVKVEVKDIQNLKKILMSISNTQYLRMQRRVKQVQRHFVIHETPKRFDVFHMTVHSIWLRRLNVQIKDF